MSTTSEVTEHVDAHSCLATLAQNNMKKKALYVILIVIGLAIVSASLFPAGTRPEVRQYLRDSTAMKALGTWLNDYALKHGSYPDDLSVFKDKNIWDRKDAFLPYLDSSQTIYCKPETNTPQKTFILLIRPIKFKNGVFIVQVDGTTKVIDKRGVFITSPEGKTEVINNKTNKGVLGTR